MYVVANVAGETIKKDVVSIRTTDDAEWARSAVQRLLRPTLTADTAVQIALLNNRGLQAAYNDLTLSQADFVLEILQPNPSSSFPRMSEPGESATKCQMSATSLALSVSP